MGTERRPLMHANVTERHYKSIQDTILSYFDFLHYTQIHCLKDQWWAFGPPLCAEGPIKKLDMTFEDMVKLFYSMTFIPKLHILATRGQTSGFFTIFGTLW